MFNRNIKYFHIFFYDCICVCRLNSVYIENAFRILLLRIFTTKSVVSTSPVFKLVNLKKRLRAETVKIL